MESRNSKAPELFNGGAELIAILAADLEMRDKSPSGARRRELITGEGVERRGEPWSDAERREAPVVAQETDRYSRLGGPESGSGSGESAFGAKGGPLWARPLPLALADPLSSGPNFGARFGRAQSNK